MPETRYAKYADDIQAIHILLAATPSLLSPGSRIQEYFPLPSTDWMRFAESDSDGRRQYLDFICARRFKLADTHTDSVPPAAMAGWRGRFLAYDPEASLSDGAAMIASAGFYSFDNAPPSVLWLDYISDHSDADSPWTPFSAYVLCWIPDLFREYAARGMQENAEGCLRWMLDQ